jgi:hypothetical protein
VIRTDRIAQAQCSLRWNGEHLATIAVTPGEGFAEHVAIVPGDRVRAENRIERQCESLAGIGVYHDWLYQ